MDALKHTHLLGRHLVMEWAKEGEGVDVDQLREKVGVQLRGLEGERVGKKRKVQIGGAVEQLDADE
jgi:multiple RNA-binding domain-containing protein 1